MHCTQEAVDESCGFVHALEGDGGLQGRLNARIQTIAFHVQQQEIAEPECRLCIWVEQSGH